MRRLALASEKVEGSCSGPHDAIAEIPASQERSKRRSIPHDVLAEILSRVPGRSLVRFRCVSKFWYSSFCDPHFVSLQLNQANKNPSYFIGYMHGRQDQDQIPFYSFELEASKMVASHIFTVPVESDKYCMSNPCSGLIAFSGSCYAYVANPCTQEWMALPKPTPHTRNRGYGISTGLHMDGQPCLGLGFSTATREYKLLWFFNRCDAATSSTEDERLRFFGQYDAATSTWACEILTLGTDHSWRSLGDVPYWVTDFEPAYMDGRIYWTIEDNGSPERIVSFDVCREALMVIRLPRCVHPEPYGAYRYLCMRVLEGSLCLIDWRLLLDKDERRYCPVMHIHTVLGEGEGGSLVWSERSRSIRLRKIGVCTASAATRGVVAISRYPLAIQNGKVFFYRCRSYWVLHDIHTGVDLEISFPSCMRQLMRFSRYLNAFACAESIVPIY